MKVIIYLDWAATAKPNPDLMEKVSEVSIQYYGNPSSLHAAGRDSEKLLVESRTTLAKSLACTKNEIIFTSGATESNNMLILAMLRKLHLGKSTADRPKVIISGIEHASVYEPANTLRQFGFEVTVIKADFSGRIRPEIIAEELDDNTILVSLIYVNNETGAVQSV